MLKQGQMHKDLWPQGGVLLVGSPAFRPCWSTALLSFPFLLKPLAPPPALCILLSWGVRQTEALWNCYARSFIPLWSIWSVWATEPGESAPRAPPWKLHPLTHSDGIAQQSLLHFFPTAYSIYGISLRSWGLAAGYKGEVEGRVAKGAHRETRGSGGMRGMTGRWAPAGEGVNCVVVHTEKRGAQGEWGGMTWRWAPAGEGVNCGGGGGGGGKANLAPRGVAREEELQWGECRAIWNGNELNSTFT